MTYFVVVYERVRGSLEEVSPFPSSADALKERFRMEQTRPDAEIVVLAAQSEKDLRRTHSRYFSSVDELLRKAESVAG